MLTTPQHWRALCAIAPNFGDARLFFELLFRPVQIDDALPTLHLGFFNHGANQRFVDNADPAIVEAERERRAELVVELESLRENLAGL